MGLLVKGIWQDVWYDTETSQGEFVREESTFHHQVVRKASNADDFPAEPNRYHLFVSYACPWAHRTLIFRMLKRLEQVVSVTVVSPKMLENGWVFEPYDSTLLELGIDFSYLYQVYTASVPNYTGRVTVPVLWDKKRRVIVNNESSQIIRLLNESFDEFTTMHFDFYPQKLRPEIDRLNDFIYESINNGVYRCGFATTQQAYESAFDVLFAALSDLDRRLSRQRFLVGNRLTEADWRLFTTLIRFDVVYYSHFKTNLKRISDYPHLSQYLKDLYQIPGIKETVNFEHIKQHYYYSHATINPYRIVPKGPELDLDGSHNRIRFGSEPILME